MAPYPAAVVLAVFGAISVVLDLPPLIWHFKAKNIGASSVMIWVILTNFLNCMNAIIWPDDDFAHRFDGRGLCDVEVKLQVASQVALPASFACILRALAAVMDTDKLTVTKAHKRRDTIIDLTICIAVPLLHMLFHYIVQSTRYALIGVSGCLAVVSNNVVSIVLILIPPLIWTIVCAYYAGLVVFRLYRYRRSFKIILQHNGTNKSRFLRLFLLCIIWVLASVPVACYVFAVSAQVPLVAFDWAELHDPVSWRTIMMLPSYGIAVYDRWIWLTVGFCMFLFFGFGKDALQTYKSMYVCSPCLSRPNRGSEHAHTTNSSDSRAQMIKKRHTISTDDTVSFSFDLEAMQHPATRL